MAISKLKDRHEARAERKVKYSSLTQEGIDYCMSMLSPYKDMSIEEIKSMTAGKPVGTRLSEAVIEDRREARY